MENEAKNEEPRPQFGNRYLVDKSEVFAHNAWDNVEWDDEQKTLAAEKVENNSKIKMDQESSKMYEEDAAKFWDKFYEIHNNRFFKDRTWLFTEFSELTKRKDEKHDQKEVYDKYPGYKANHKILEVGCGVGNTIFPILEISNDPDIFLYGCDFSNEAVSIVKTHAKYSEDRVCAFQWDITKNSPDTIPFPEGSLNIVILIFVLSAVHPDKMRRAINNLVPYLKPGGLLLFRDYGRHDMAQLRFKPGKCVQDNFYVRGDGTQVYFFTQEELDELFSSCGLIKEQNIIDRRLQVNRGKQIKMFRVWIQCKYRKIS